MGKSKKVVIDTNVFISGFGWDGKPEEILALLKERHIINYISTEIFNELRRVVSYPKFKFKESLQIKILEFVFFYSEFVEPKENILFITDDPEDNKFLECAIEANTKFIISGDAHLLNLQRFRNIEVVDVNGFLHKFLRGQ